MLRLLLGGITCAALLILVVHTLFTASKPLCDHCNVVLISVGALGAEHTSVYSPSATTTPFLKKLMNERGVVFEAAYAQAPWPHPSYVALFTGDYPWQYDGWDGTAPLPEEATTIAERLARLGYTTAAFADSTDVHPAWGMLQGFQTYDGVVEESLWRTNSEILVDASAWMKTSTQPFFTFIRLGDLHTPAGTTYADYLDRITAEHLSPDGPDPVWKESVLRSYDERLRATDTALETFFAELEASGLAENTVVIITADNGIEFGEHGLFGVISLTLYKGSIHVPLLVVYPNAPPKRIPASVELRSVPETIMELTGLNRSKDSLVGYIRGTDTGDRLVLSRTTVGLGQETPTEATMSDVHRRTLQNASAGFIQGVAKQNEFLPVGRSAIYGSWHGVHHIDGSAELYDLLRDPAETTNRINEKSNRISGDWDHVQTILREITP